MIRGESLHRLQNLDYEIEQGQQRVSQIQASIGETEALRQTRRALTSAEEELRDWEAKARHLELEIEGLSSKIAASEKRLYSGTVTNPKELSDIQDEIASLKRRCSDLEDELLEAMVYSEEAAASLETCRTLLADTEAQWQKEQATLNAELSELDARLLDAQDERDRLRSATAGEDLALYDKIRSRYGSITVTTLRNGVCGYCAVAPSSTKLARIHNGRELLQCGNCKRVLLYL
jgi:predicted  nucleic acid-binding Zn-ribbon protein